MKNIIRNIVILLVVLVLSYSVSDYIGKKYLNYFPGESIASIDFSPIIGMPLAYIFFTSLIFSALSDSKKYWWIGILLIPTAAFEIYFDWQHIYIPIILGLVGWLGGFLISKAIAKTS